MRRYAQMLVILAGLMFSMTLNAQWREVRFDDSDMALDLTEALTFQKYPTYDQYVEMMQLFASDYPDICRLDTLGTSVEGRLLLALKISDHPDMDEAEASFFYTSTMHGDELVGFVLLLRLADYLLKGYGTDNEIDRLLDKLVIWINPLANPDGSYSADENMSLGNSTRDNAKGINLNRDFPDPGAGEPNDTTGVALENKHMMEFMETHGFTMSANIHAGAEVVNYPWDHTYDLHADNDWYRFVSSEYADEAIAVDPDYMFGWPEQGITHGAQWYIIRGGRQDYVNYYLEGREVTLELSNEKLLGSEYLEEHWNINKRSLLNYMAQCMYGLRGVVTDYDNGEPVRARIRIPGHDSTYSTVHSSANHGDFYRLIKEGVYDLEVSAPGYITESIWSVALTDYKATQLEVRLVRDPNTGVGTDLQSPEFRLYPNPAKDWVYLASDPLNAGHPAPETMKIRVWSVSGILCLEQYNSSAESPVPISIEALPEGVYILKVTTTSFSGSMRFIKQ